jgi:transposase
MEVIGMEAIPVPVRKRIVTLYARGKSTAQISESLGYCVAAVRRVRQHFKERGTLEPQTHLCGRSGYFTVTRQEQLRKLVEEKPDATLAELRAKIDPPVAISTMDVWVRKLGFSFKKSPSVPASRTASTSRRSALPGTKSSRHSRRKSSYSSTNPGSKAT